MIELRGSYDPSRANQEPFIRVEKGMLVDSEKRLFFFSDIKLKGRSERDRLTERE